MRREQDLQSLEELIAGKTMSLKHPTDLLVEHLNAARRYLLAGSRLEFEMILSQALSSLSCITNKDERIRVKGVLRGLLEPGTKGT